MRIEISGMSGSARHGLGSAVELPTPNTHAAKAFFGQLTAALAAVEPAADGHALVQVETVPRQSPQPGARGRQVVAIALLLVLYTLLLVALGQVSPRKAGTAALSLSVGGVLGLAAGFTLWRMGRRIRSLWLLRRRGILAAETVGSQVELRYDPEHPDRASRPLTVGFAFRALLVAAVALVPGAAFALCVLVNLPV
ncbi:hypothetical protein ACFYUJ_27450 [Streptomyces sp. NPDC004520]|uniref:hypothetical protein n=1 Tax=Streptomyces sp. NPDC004520 TaxID=3364702 RepID=UPI0036B15840